MPEIPHSTRLYYSGIRIYGATYCKVMDQAQVYTHSIPWIDYNDAREKIEIDTANKLPDEGLPIFNRTFTSIRFI